MVLWSRSTVYSDFGRGTAVGWIRVVSQVRCDGSSSTRQLLNYSFLSSNVCHGRLKKVVVQGARLLLARLTPTWVREDDRVTQVDGGVCDGDLVRAGAVVGKSAVFGSFGFHTLDERRFLPRKRLDAAALFKEHLVQRLQKS